MFTTRLSIGWPSSLLLRFIDTLGYFQNSIHDRQWPWMVFSRIHWVNSPEYHSMILIETSTIPRRKDTKIYALSFRAFTWTMNTQTTSNLPSNITIEFDANNPNGFFGQRPWSFLGGSSLFIQVIWQFAYTWSVSQPGYADACDGSNVGSRDSWVRFKLWISKFEFQFWTPGFWSQKLQVKTLLTSGFLAEFPFGRSHTQLELIEFEPLKALEMKKLNFRYWNCDSHNRWAEVFGSQMREQDLANQNENRMKHVGRCWTVPLLCSLPSTLLKVWFLNLRRFL